MSDGRVHPPANDTVVVVTERVLFPTHEGSQVRIVALVRTLQRAGFRVVLVARRAPWRRFPLLPGPRSTWCTWRLADVFMGVESPAFGGGSPMNFDVAPYVRALRTAIDRHRPCAVIAEYIWMAPCLDAVPDGILRLVDTHDMMHVRDAMYRDQSEGAWVVCTEAEEASLLSYADVILAIQEQERAMFARMVPSKRVVCIPHVVAGSAAPAQGGRRAMVGFVGSCNQGNVVAVRTFIDEAWPLVRARCPDAELHVFGDVVRRVERDVPGVKSIGFVSDLVQVYHTAAVIINPLTLGTGLKIKTVEALAHGAALVTTSCGAAGLEEGAGHAFVLEDDMAAFGRAVAALLEDPARREAYARTAQTFARERFGEDAAARSLRALLDPAPRAPSLDAASVNLAGRAALTANEESSS